MLIIKLSAYTAQTALLCPWTHCWGTQQTLNPKNIPSPVHVTDAEALQEVADELEGEERPLPIEEEDIYSSLQSLDSLDAAGETERQRLNKEAKAGGFGSLYAAFGGGLEGLKACAAGDDLLFCGIGCRLNAQSTVDHAAL